MELARYIGKLMLAVAAVAAVTIGLIWLVYTDWQAAARQPRGRLRVYVSTRTSLAKGVRLDAADLSMNLGRLPADGALVVSSQGAAGTYAVRDLPPFTPIEPDMIAAKPLLEAKLRGAVVQIEISATLTAGFRPGMWLGVVDEKGNTILDEKKLPEAVRLVAVMPSKDLAKNTLHVAIHCDQYRLLKVFVAEKWRPIILAARPES